MTLAASDTPRRTVLVVEDDPSIRELLQLHLALTGLEVTEVGDGRQALDLGRSKRFDLLVLDVMLPHLDGITLCRSLRCRRPYSRSR